MESKNRAYLHTVESAAWVPLAQSAITALLVAILLAIVLGELNVRRWWWWSLGGGAISLVWMWWQALGHWRMLTYTLESWSGLDLNRDRAIGDPAEKNAPSTPAAIKVTLNRVSEAGHFSAEIFDLPCTEDQLRALAEGLLFDGLPFTEREWAGAGKPFSSSEFREVRSVLLKRGLVELASDKDARQGYALTSDGSQFMSNYLER